MTTYNFYIGFINMSISSPVEPLKLHLVSTPNHLTFPSNPKTLHEIGAYLRSEIRMKGSWTDECSTVLKNNPKVLFLYDRFEFIFGNAYGHSSCKILLNPNMVICMHPSCLESNVKDVPVVRLSHPFHLDSYLLHLERHCDRMGEAMKLRFGMLRENMFIPPTELDKISIAPHCLQTVKKGNDKTRKILQLYGIDRNFNTNYICHWKAKLIASGLIDSASLLFQEDEAFIAMVLNFPNPIREWSLWNTIYLYGLKLLTSVSSTALNLYRGTTNYPRLNVASSDNVNDFASFINHASPSLTAYQRDLPDLNYSNVVYQGGEILYHIKSLQKSDDSLGLKYSANNVLRFPITLGIDEQELNPGTFIHNGTLNGLVEKMNVKDIEQIGINNLAHHIAEKNNFIKGVRENRATDFKGIVCSNVLTEFISHELTGKECIERLQRSTRFSNSCYKCLVNHVDCKYDRIDASCSYCVDEDALCVSLVVLHILWDMGSGHKRADLDYYHLEKDSPASEMFSSLMSTIGFGGLHLCKSFVCTARNYVLKHNGEHFGVNILMELKQHCEILQSINNAVFIGRDKQSDLLNHTLVGEKTQLSLKSSSKYLVTRVPEKYLTYKDNVKTQKRIINPKGISCNRNGDIFLLDSGLSCIHVIDNSIIAKVCIVGSYDKPQKTPYGALYENSLNNVRFGNDLSEIQVDPLNDNVVVLDTSREEVIIMKGCVNIKTLFSRKFYILMLNNVQSIALNEDLYALRKLDDDFVIQKIKFALPKKSKSGKEKVSVDFDIFYAINMSVDLSIMSLFYVPYPDMVGGFDTADKSSHIIPVGCKELKKQVDLTIKSEVVPFLTTDNKIICCLANQISIYKLADITKTVTVKLLDHIQIDGQVKGFTMNGKVVSLVAAMEESMCTNEYSVLEWGSTGFSLLYCEAISNLYDAISYVPPHGNPKQMTLDECIEQAEICRSLLSDMQKERVSISPSRNTFIGCDGIPWSKTISCLERTVESWKVLKARMEILAPGSSQLIYPHSICNESYVEHSFGFIKNQGQGHNLSQEEYIQAKRSHMVDFQMRMCKLPFNQHTKTKLRDKGYQSLESREVPMSLKEFKEIFHYGKPVVQPEENVSQADQQLLKRAHLLSKYVPRQSSRNRWRAMSGQTPSMIANRNASTLHENDMVFFRSIEGDISKLIVKKSFSLANRFSPLKVWSVDMKKDMVITVEHLLCHKQQILTVPQACYVIESGYVVFSDQFRPIFESIKEEITVSGEGFSEEDWNTILVNVDENNTSKESDTQGSKPIINRETWKDKKGNVVTRKAKVGEKRKLPEAGFQMESRIVSDEEDISDLSEVQTNLFADLKEIPVLDRRLLMWVKVLYEGEIFLGKIMNIHEDQCLVRCLKFPFGVHEGEFQDLESEHEAVWYGKVYRTDVDPSMIREHDTDGKEKRRGKFRYIYGKALS